MDINELLSRQLGENYVNADELPESFRRLLLKVSETYSNFEQSLAQRTQQLIASTSQAYSFLDSINKGFVMCDASGEVVLTNESFRNIFSLKTLEGQEGGNTITIDSMNMKFSPDLEIKNLVSQCLNNRAVIEHDDVNFGKAILHLYLAPLLTSAGSDEKQMLGIVMLFEDVTEQKLLDRSKDEFLSIASHELRTPLTAIRGNSALIKKYYSGTITDKNLSEMIDDIHASSVRLIGIVNDFLDVASIEQGKIKMQPANFSLAETIGEVVRELDELCKSKGLALVKDPSVDNTPDVYADKIRIKQVIINLVGNAIKFTEQGSITISTWSDDNFVHTVVTDTGKGMEEESQKLLFRKFQQAEGNLLTRDTTKGTGLGLYISKQLIDLSGGEIGLQSSKPNEGSAFAFTLPKAK
jgi:signal transduction histidine kinase